MIVLPAVPAELRALRVAAWSEPVVIDTYLPASRTATRRSWSAACTRALPAGSIRCRSASASRRTKRAPPLAGRAPGEPLRPADDPAGARRPHPRRPATRPPATTSSTATTSSSRRWSAWPGRGSPAAWSSTGRSTTGRPPSCPPTSPIERDDDGSVTVWCSDHDPLARMKGMHGIRLRPDRARHRAAGAAVQPHRAAPDVPLVGQRRRRGARRLPVVLPHRRHSRRRPRQARGHHLPAGRPAATTASTTPPGPPTRPTPDARPARLVPQHPGADLVHGRRHRGRLLRRLRPRAPARASCTGPTATSRPARSSGPGATHRSARPGTRNLTDADGPYVELMAGVYTDNQPDFSFLAPGETKTFSQYWYPIQRHRPGAPGHPRRRRQPRLARDRRRQPLSRRRRGDRATARDAVISLPTPTASSGGRERCRSTVGTGVVREVELPGLPADRRWRSWSRPAAPTLVVVAAALAARRSRRRCRPPSRRRPADIASNDELYLTGAAPRAVPARHPVARAVLARGAAPGPGRRPLQRRARRRGLHDAGRYDEALPYLERAVARSVARNPNPADGDRPLPAGASPSPPRPRRPRRTTPLGKAAW